MPAGHFFFIATWMLPRFSLLFFFRFLYFTLSIEDYAFLQLVDFQLSASFAAFITYAFGRDTPLR